MFQDMDAVLPLFQDMVGSAANCLSILWEVLSIIHDMVSKAVHVSGYGVSDVNAGSIANVTGYCGKCCQCFRI